MLEMNPCRQPARLAADFPSPSSGGYWPRTAERMACAPRYTRYATPAHLIASNSGCTFTMSAPRPNAAAVPCTRLELLTPARRLPDAVFLPVDRAAYEEVSETVMAVLRSTGAVVEVLGWDEAFLGVEVEDPEGFARALARLVREATDLDCTVGIGENKLQAKIATGFGKPAEVFRLTFANWFSVLGARPTDALWGIGAKTAKKLAGLGIRTVSDLAAADPDALAAEFGPMTGPWLVLLGRGRGDADVDDTPYVARGHGREETFQRNIADWSRVQAEVARIAGLLASDLASEPRPAVRVVVKVRYAPFITETHGVTLAAASSEASVISQAAAEALARFTGRRPVRLLGVRADFGS